jgi:FkbM family methyltransferase
MLLAAIGIRGVRAMARTFWGESMLVQPSEPVSGQILRTGFYEEGLTRMLLEMLGAGMTFIDVGAHFGYYSRLASYIVGPAGRVFAFEPMPSTFEYLRRNTEGRPNITIANAAVHSHATTLIFRDLGIDLSAFASHKAPRLPVSTVPPDAPTVDVPALTLDGFCTDRGVRPDFVKIDAESSEWQVIEGMREVIARHKPILTVEVGDCDLPGVRPSSDVVALLLGCGYRAFEYGSLEQSLRAHKVRERYEYDNLIFLP